MSPMQFSLFSWAQRQQERERIQRLGHLIAAIYNASPNRRRGSSHTARRLFPEAFVPIPRPDWWLDDDENE
jgi:hypothetical protein